jgi:ribosome biogenesis GTPase / thiamine phosphate phosphatase
MSGSSFEAQVTAAFGRHVLVRDGSGTLHKARPLGRMLAPVCGDRVRCEADTVHREVHVTEILTRRTALYRASRRGASEPVCANLSLLLIVCAPRPSPDFFVIDRYLSAATSGGIGAQLVLNKHELGVDEELRRELGEYARFAIPTLECSVREGRGIDALIASCQGQTAALVGQSGVGKSSLVLRIVPGAEAAIGELVRETEGRHTTTASRLYDLPGGGHLIDSPGVRDFAPAIDRLEPRSLGFADIEKQASGCRFADCRHMREPSCAVRTAAESGDLHARRYESYRRLRRLHEQLTATRGPG